MNRTRYRPPTREVWMHIKDPAKLRRRRKARDMTQFQLAVMTRCTQQYVSLLESGRDRDCSEDVALRICKALDVDLEDYFEAREVSRTPRVATASRVDGDDAA
ncbi:helix-turn-helix transcriptional regulator [Nocardioides sp. AX2bis]|uniref:helix-turn-helix transcriptional regulator n=1 Tax=Nocardioides sp. AX2bis TaxID=2653157 RepID=UPI0012F23624|nr:helix-turn-helix transcriptional regulator [Nocardioides sp. AX2bis]VXB34163.1 DNA-binding transcriptional regulator, XRE-family HTH domain [Nocardioides sp. AX2bis]